MGTEAELTHGKNIRHKKQIYNSVGDLGQFFIVVTIKCIDSVGKQETYQL